MDDMKNWSFNRPYCSPNSGFVMARTGEEAIALVNGAYGYCSGTNVKGYDRKGELVCHAGAEK